MSSVREILLRKDAHCCREGRNSYMDLEHAALLQGEGGYEHLTDEVIVYREERCRIADGCQFSKTGRCVLEEAGMKEPYPTGYEIEE